MFYLALDQRRLVICCNTLVILVNTSSGYNSDPRKIDMNERSSSDNDKRLDKICYA